TGERTRASASPSSRFARGWRLALEDGDTLAQALDLVAQVPELGAQVLVPVAGVAVARLEALAEDLQVGGRVGLERRDPALDGAGAGAQVLLGGRLAPAHRLAGHFRDGGVELVVERDGGQDQAAEQGGAEDAPEDGDVVFLLLLLLLLLRGRRGRGRCRGDGGDGEESGLVEGPLA